MPNNKTRLSGQTRLLISDQVLRKICEIFFELFLSTYMYKISEENGILYLSLYQVIRWVTTCTLVFGVNRIINRFSKVWIYRLGVSIKLSIILLVALLGPNIVPLFWLIAILDGLMVACNGYIINYFESENIPKVDMIRYIGLGNAFSSITNTLVPIVLGSSIFINSFETTAFALSAIVALELAICFGLKNKRPKHHHRKLNYHKFLKIALRDPSYRSICLQQFLSGINRNGVMSLLISVLIFQSVGNELSFGGWTSLFSVSGIVAMFLFGRFYKNRYRAVVQITAGAVIIIGCLPLLFEANIVNVAIFNIIFYTLARTMEKVVHLDLVNYSKTEKYHSRYLVEYYSIREVFLSAGRILGYGTLAFVSFLGLGLTGVRATLILIMASVALMAIASARFSPKQK